MSTLATDNAINMDSFRADAYSFVQDYEKLLLERNALKFDLETAKNSSLKDEARYVLLKKENVHLKEELDSSLTHIDQNIQNIVCHFKAKDELDRMRSEIKGLHDLVYEKTNANSGLLSQLHALKTEMDRAEAIHLSDCSAHEKQLADLKASFDSQQSKWKTQLNEATLTCRNLQIQLDTRESKSQSATAGSKSMEVMWKQRVLGLRNEVKRLQQENEQQKSQINHLENFRPKARATQKRKKANTK